MTQQDIEKAFAAALQNNEFKSLDITKHQRYMLNNKEVSTAKKLEVLWMLGKLQLK